MSIVGDTGIVLVRELRPTLRDPFSMLFTLAQPIVLLAFFGPLLGSMPGFDGTATWQWFVPGILVMIGLFGTSMTGSNLQYEMLTGSHERMMVTPLSRSALLIGKALKEMVPLMVSAIMIVALVLPFGFRLYPLGALLGLLLLGLFGIGLGSLSYALAIATRNQQWVFWAVQQTLTFPLLILSGMMLPLDTGPQWMRVLSQFNPVTYVVDAERTLFRGEIGSTSALFGGISALGIALVGLAIGIRGMRKAAL